MQETEFMNRCTVEMTVIK